MRHLRTLHTLSNNNSNKYENIRKVVYDEMRRKEEEIKQNFVAKVREKEVALK